MQHIEAHLESITATAAAMIADGTLDADNIDWDALKSAHMLRLYRLQVRTGPHVLKSAWQVANAGAPA